MFFLPLVVAPAFLSQSLTEAKIHYLIHFLLSLLKKKQKTQKTNKNILVLVPLMKLCLVPEISA